MTVAKDDAAFQDAVAGLRGGSFSRLEPLLDAGRGPSRTAPRLIAWCEEGRFLGEPAILAEALTCASFLGKTTVVEYLLSHGVNPSGGAGTGLDALHWAANRGQLEAVRLLVRWKAPLETRNMYGDTVLGTAIWSALNEPRGEQLRIIEELLKAGARVEDVEDPGAYVKGWWRRMLLKRRMETIDALLRAPRPGGHEMTPDLTGG
jgi:hypothetical protein